MYPQKPCGHKHHLCPRVVRLALALPASNTLHRRWQLIWPLHPAAGVKLIKRGSNISAGDLRNFSAPESLSILRFPKQPPGLCNQHQQSWHAGSLTRTHTWPPHAHPVCIGLHLDYMHVSILLAALVVVLPAAYNVSPTLAAQSSLPVVCWMPASCLISLHLHHG